LEADAAVRWGGVRVVSGQSGVGERDVPTFNPTFQARFEAVCLEYLQCGVAGVTVAGGAARRFAECFTQLVGALVKGGPRGVPGAFSVLEGAGQQPPGEVVTALGQRHGHVLI
jgi:hypothetical protein